MKRKLITLMTLLLCVCSGAWAVADITYNIGTTAGTCVKQSDNITYKCVPSTEMKAKNKTVWVEVPGNNVKGSIVFYGSADKDDRFLYIYKTNGTVKDDTRKAQMKANSVAAGTIAYTSDDILTDDGKYYLVFSSTDDFKAKNIDYTAEVEPADDPVFSLTKTTISMEETSQIQVGTKGNLGGITFDGDVTFGTAGIVTVSAEGVVTPVAQGATTINFATNAVDGKYNASTGNSLTITVTAPVVATPTLTAGGYFTNDSKTVEIACATDGATIKYSYDNESWSDYLEALSITATKTVYAKAVKSGMIDSDVASATYTKFVKSELASISGAKTWTFPTSLTLQLKNDGSTTPAKYDDYFTYADIATINGNNLGTFDGSTLAFSGEYPYRGSNGAQNANFQFETTVLGTVTIEFSNTGSSNKERWLKVNETTGTIEANGTTKRTESFSVDPGTVTISHVDKDGNLSGGLRVYSISFTPASVSGTITACGWSTFTSDCALDLNNITNGSAYYASAATGSTVTLTPTTAKVPAGTGLMIKGTAGATFTIATTSEETTDLSATNLLKPGTGESVTSNPLNNKYCYVFGYADADTYGFYYINPEGTTTSATVAAGKAYLETATAPEQGARISIVFDDEETGINDVKSVQKNDNRYYNLNGLEVAQPTKGLYIVNGKKVVIK